MLDDPIVHQYFSDVRMEWHNLKKAPGGDISLREWSTKRCLKRTVGQAKLTYNELSTVVTEVEIIMNSRPLSYVSTEDLQELPFTYWSSVPHPSQIHNSEGFQ